MKYFKKYCLFVFVKFVLNLVFGTNTTCQSQAQFIPFGTTNMGAGNIIYGCETKPHYDSTAVIAKEVLTSVPFHVSAAVTGFSSLTTNIAYYVKQGKNVIIFINFSGVSNATSLTFTLPFPSANLGTSQPFGAPIVIDNSIQLSLPGKISVVNNSTLVRCYSTLLSGLWTAAGTKQIQGTFTYIIQ